MVKRFDPLRYGKSTVISVLGSDSWYVMQMKKGMEGMGPESPEIQKSLTLPANLAGLHQGFF